MHRTHDDPHFTDSAKVLGVPRDAPYRQDRKHVFTAGGTPSRDIGCI
jgi:hypothetical protein